MLEEGGKMKGLLAFCTAILGTAAVMVILFGNKGVAPAAVQSPVQAPVQAPAVPEPPKDVRSLDSIHPYDFAIQIFNNTGPTQCMEFDHRTSRNGLKQLCRMLWCGNSDGGLTTLWCERDFSEK